MKLLYLLVLLVLVISCRKFTQIDPPSDQLVSPLPFSNEATATATVLGIYSEMMNGNTQFSSGYTTLFAGLAADELTYVAPGFQEEFARNEITPANHTNLTDYFWAPAYRYIYTSNLVLEELSKTTALPTDVKSSLMSEAKFIRAFCFFHLVNLFGAVPLPLTSDFRINANMPRTATGAVNAQIIQDLQKAKNALPAIDATGEKIRPTKTAASALLARIYLYVRDWEAAEKEATLVLTSGYAALEEHPDLVFLKNSWETIWQLKPVDPNLNTYEAKIIFPPDSTIPPAYLVTDNLLASFDPADQRKQAWVGYQSRGATKLAYPAKYKNYNGANLTEYYVVLRLAEQFLIRAEARTHLGKLPEALQDLNEIRSRAGLPAIDDMAAEPLLNAIEEERRHELMAEWGQRWFDLKRTGRTDTILSALKPATWQATDTLWPIPQDQINLNRVLTQNPGY